MRFFLASLLALAAAAPPPPPTVVAPQPGDARACDPVGCYPATSFSVTGNYGNLKTTRNKGTLYYNNTKTDFKWKCSDTWKYVFTDLPTDLPYPFQIRDSASVYSASCMKEYKEVRVKYGAVEGRMKDLPNCSKTGKRSYRCIFKADGTKGSGL